MTARPRAARARPRAASSARPWTGWGGVALGVLAWWIALPPLLVRTPVPSLVLAAGRVGARACGRCARAQRRLGWGAVVAGVLGAIGAIAATQSGEGNLERVVVWSALAAAMLRFATPLVFGALGGVVSERSGVVNIGLEGMMLVRRLLRASTARTSPAAGSAGCCIGMLAGGVLALVHAVFAISLRADQIVSGFAVNFLALGITGYVFLHHYGEKGTPDGLPAGPRRLAPDRRRSRSSGRRWTTSTCSSGSRCCSCFGSGCSSSARRPGCACARWARTRGRRRRSASRSTRSRYFAVIASGVLAAMGGAFLSLGFVHSFNQNMTAGRGFIALAVVIVGKWRPGAALVAALMFGFTQALAQRLPVFSESSATLLQALPYVVTLIAVAGLVGPLDPAGGGRGAVLEGVGECITRAMSLVVAGPGAPLAEAS